MKVNNVKPCIFIHGGPGLSSKADQMLTESKLEKSGNPTLFWNEPRSFKSEFLYEELVDSARDFILNANLEKYTLLGHSYGAQIVKDLLITLPEESHPNHLVLLSPVLRGDQNIRRIIDHSCVKYKEQGTLTEIKKLRELEGSLGVRFSDNHAAAMELCFGSQYFTDNFVSQDNFLKYFSNLVDEYEFRVDDFLKIRLSEREFNLKHEVKLNVPTKVILGKHDPTVKLKYLEKPLGEFLNKFEDVSWECSHYPHIECWKEFISLLANV